MAESLSLEFRKRLTMAKEEAGEMADAVYLRNRNRIEGQRRVARNIKRMEDCEHTVRLISVIIECLRNNAMEKAQGFQKVIFCIKGLKILYIKGVVR